jgi:hypothetical protein
MTPKQFVTHRHKLGLSQAELGRALGFKGDGVNRTVRRFELGETDIPGPVANLMLAMLAGFRPPSWPQKD